MQEHPLLFDVEPLQKTKSRAEKLERKAWHCEQKLKKAERRLEFLEEELIDAEELCDSLRDELEILQIELENIHPNRNQIARELDWLYLPAIPATQYDMILPTPILWLDRV